MSKWPVVLVLGVVLAAPTWAQAGDEIAWTEPEVIAEHVPGERIGISLRGLIEPGGRTFVVWSEATAKGERVLVAERDAKGVWTRTELASIDFASDLEPRIVRADDGTLVVGWGGCLGLKGGGYCLRKAGASSWTKPQPIHPQCAGKLDLVGGAKVTVAYVRAVKKTDLGKLFGNVIHDPPRQEYDKIAVAQLNGDSWSEAVVLEKDNLLRCDDPRLAGETVVYFREPEKESFSSVLVESSLSGKDPSLVISKSSAFRYGTEATAALWNDEPVVAFRDEAGVVVRRRSKDGWGESSVVLPRMGFGIQLVATNTTIHAACATGGRGTVHYAATSADKPPSVTSSLPGWRCGLCLDGGEPVLFIAQQEKVTGTITADYRIVMVRQAK